MSRIAIIGGGAAGIAAARCLAEHGKDYVLLEAKPFTGGRCVTDHATLGAPIDLGAHWLHSPALNPLVGYADRLGIRYSRAALAGRYSRNGAWLNAKEQAACETYVEECFARIAACDGDVAISALFPDTNSPWHDVFLAEQGAKQGVAAATSSSRDFANYVWEGDDCPVTDGFGTLLSQLADGLNIRVDTPVNRIDWSGRDIKLTTPDGILVAQRIILATSTAILHDGIEFAPALPDWKRRAIADLPLGSCNKVALRFSRPVFGDCPPSLILPLRGAHEAVEIVVRESDLEIATCLFNGPFAKELAAAGHPAMANYALERLSEIFGSDVKQASMPQYIIADWDHDLHIRGCYAAARVGRADARAELARPIDDRLFFAGEACSTNYMGDVHGAWFSGIAAAEAASA
ncbi:flavin monoamine oxidase family protein [Dongia rigui]|uniref:Tryptophan 2-monooxygenase n=1 Tax=Dongia rigui TaxID=940149 RepID=A0ABU5E3K1_9PROT|nr:NAD(P)/FAD-dependent oxidoreductase [Dongia rigui]MDY0873907.1 NAD(P)/FAD-dependent oxidoreductase [Dongia rigui]